MMTKRIVLAVFAWVMVIGCGSRQYFEPETRYSLNAQNRYQGKIVDVSREGVTLDDGRYIGKDGISKISLGEGFRFLNEDDRYVLASNARGILKIIDKTIMSYRPFKLM